MLRKILFLTVVWGLFVVSGSLFGSSAAMDYDHKIEVEKISFEWKLDGDVMHIQIGAETTGWVGIGFNPSDEMKDAGFVLGYVKDGEVKITDDFGTAGKQHEPDNKLDGKDDISNAEGSEENGRTVIRFTIPLNSGDPHDQVIAAGKENTVLLAYSTGRDSFKTRHQFRTALRVDLKTGTYTNLK